MSDDIDHAQERETIERERALAAYAARPRPKPQATCSCGESITALRQSLRACRCMHCQQIFERGAR